MKKLITSINAVFVLVAGTGFAQTTVLNGTSGNATNSSNFSTGTSGSGITLSQRFLAEYLIVGGGGGGGGGGFNTGLAGGGGGGEAGVVSTGSSSITSGSYDIVVGVGGSGGGGGQQGYGWNGEIGVSGSSSSAFGVTSAGGSYGWGAAMDTSTTWSDGTGGWGGWNRSNQGGGKSNSVGGAGGGGAGSFGVGGAASGSTGGVGGTGTADSLTGSSQTYGVGGAGGTGNSANVIGATGAANTGNGGGGGGGTSSGAAKSGGAGGSGLVVVRYQGSQAGTGGTISAGSGSAAGYTLHTFTSTGSNALNLSGLNLDTRLKTTLTGVISGSGNLTYNGPGTLSLAAAATHSGGTTVNGGTLQVSVAPTWGTSMLGTGAITVNGATLQALNHHQFGFAAGTQNSLTINDGGTLARGAYDQFIGTLILNDNASITGSSGYIGLANGSLTYNGSSASKQAIIASNVQLSNSSAAVNATITVNGTNTSGDLVINGGIWEDGGGLTKAGTGTLVLNAANSYTDGTTVNAGTIRVGNNAALGTGTATLNGGALSSNSTTARTLANNFVIGGDVTLGDATNNGVLTLSGTVGLGGAVRTLTVASNASLGGTVSNGALTKAGAGTLTLNAANTFTGDTRVGSGTLSLNHSNALASSTLNMASSDSGTVAFGLAGNNTYNIGGITGSKNLAIGSNVLSVGAKNENSTYSGQISGIGSLTKTGSGKLIISGNNTYTGATAVNDGSLAVNGSLGNTAVSVGSNATLQGSGSIGGSVTITSAGTLSAGNSIESLAMGTLTLQSGSNFIQEVDSSATVGTQADLVVVNGNLNIADGAVSLTLTDLAGSWNWVNDTKFTMINYSGTWNGGLFVWNGDVLEDDSNIIIADDKGWRINYNDTTGGSNYSSEQTYSKFVTLTAVPEPTVVMLGGLGALLLLRRRRA
jgi:fibronectin-binding autotransporter adhesin